MGNHIQTMGQLSTLSAVLLLLPAALASSDWSYDHHGGSGPEHWDGECRGQSQSPIDLEEQELTVSLPPLSLADYDQVPVSSLLVNNGHSVKLTNQYSAGLTPQMSGAGLNDHYKFAQVHFHWGNDSSRGSEHTLNGQAFPMEMHLVHHNASFKDINEAAKQKSPSSLAVLGIFFKVSSTAHPGVNKLLPFLREVRTAGSQVEVTPRLVLSDLVPGDLSQVYRYSGSLTTPGCNEIVQWTVVKKPVQILEEQMEEFRQLLTKDNTPLVDNYRPTQNLNNRKVIQAYTGPARWCSVLHPEVRAGASSLSTFSLPLLLLLLITSLNTPSLH